MQIVVSPEILQLLALGVADVDARDDLGEEHRDHYLHPGRYLRWLPNAALGFPRRGFVLKRRPSPRWPWVKRTDMAEALVENARSHGPALWLQAAGFGEGIERKGARLSKPGVSLNPGGQSVGFDSGGLMVELRDNEQAPRPDPASWVALRVRAKNHVTVSATAWAAGRTPAHDAVLSEASGRIGDLDPWDFTTPGGDRVLIVHGGLVDAVEMHADDPAALVAVTWLITERYAVDGSNNSQQRGWEEVGRFLLPFDGDGQSYPSQSDADDVAEERLALAAPRARPPWADPDWPPTPVDAVGIAGDLADRHLGEALDQARMLLDAVLAGEVAGQGPQGSVRVDPSLAPGVADGAGYEITNPDGSPAGIDETANADVPAVPLMLAASLDAPVAHLLGLATVDRDAPDDRPYDYVVSAVYPLLWLPWLLAPHMPMVLAGQSALLAQAAQGSGQLPLVPPLPPDPVDADAPFFRAVSVATMVLPGPVAPVPDPEDVEAETIVVPGRTPVPAEALVTWRSEEQPAFHPAPVVGATTSRVDAEGQDSLARTDPVHGHRLPYLSGAGEHLLRDNGLRVQGDTAWYVRHLDLWGRWSMGAKATAHIDVRVPPPAPSGVTATLRGAIDDDAGTVAEIEVAFDWTAGQQAMAPGVTHFEVALASGDLVDDLAAVDGSEGSAQVDADGGATTVGTVSASDLDDGGGLRIAVAMADAPAAANGYRRETTAAVVAVAADGERSAPAGALAEIVDAAPPPPPQGLPGVQFSSWPDADGLGWWTCQWQASEGVRVQVLRASGSRLLEAAGQDRSALPDDLDEQGADLRALAAAVYADGDDPGPGSGPGDPKHAHAFSPDHPRAHEHPADRHAISVDGSSRDLTVVVALPTGPTGTRAPWPTDPDAFTVVAARRLDSLVPPRVVARAVGDGEVRVEVSAPGAAARVRLWRASDPARVDDLRRMRPLAPTDIDGEGEATVTDGPLAGATWLAYRAVAESADGRRSAPTAPVWVHVR